VEKDSYWAKNYNMFINHPKAMDVIAEELSKNCDLPLHALQLWVGSHYTGYGIVFFDDSMVPRKRTPEDTEKLHKLERLLESMAILKTEKAKFDVLCSAACLAHPVEPALVAKRPPPPDWERNKGQELMCLMDELMEKYPRRRQRKSGEEKDSGDKTVGSKKRQNQPRSEGHHGQAVHKSRCAHLSWSLELAMLRKYQHGATKEPPAPGPGGGRKPRGRLQGWARGYAG